MNYSNSRSNWGNQLNWALSFLIILEDVKYLSVYWKRVRICQAPHKINIILTTRDFSLMFDIKFSRAGIDTNTSKHTLFKIWFIFGIKCPHSVLKNVQKFAFLLNPINFLLFCCNRSDNIKTPDHQSRAVCK